MTRTGEALYDRIGVNYDATRRVDPGLAALLHERLLLTPDLRVLDIGCGTANYTAALSTYAHFTGIDISQRMLAAARNKAIINFVRGDATTLPFADKSFDRALTTLAIHHFPDLTRALREARRVLRDGPYVVFAFFYEQTETYWLARYFPRSLLDDKKSKSQTRARIENGFRSAGFARLEIEPWFVPDAFTDGFLYKEKYRPASYLDPAFRNGISAFADSPFADEIDSGLKMLARDIEHGAIDEIIAADNDPLGDYALITAWP